MTRLAFCSVAAEVLIVRGVAGEAGRAEPFLPEGAPVTGATGNDAVLAGEREAGAPVMVEDRLAPACRAVARLAPGSELALVYGPPAGA